MRVDPKDRYYPPPPEPGLEEPLFGPDILIGAGGAARTTANLIRNLATKLTRPIISPEQKIAILRRQVRSFPNQRWGTDEAIAKADYDILQKRIKRRQEFEKLLKD